MSFISYAQNFEDVMLWRALGHVQDGRYLDIGAQDPMEFSVSLAFYEHGWRGTHVEPNIHYAKKLREARPDEPVLELALGEASGIVEFFDIKDTGLSTLQSEVAERHLKSGFEVHSRQVPMLPLDDVLDSFSGKELHWLKIDVEGAERRVLEGWRTSLVRPWVLVLESTLPLSQQESHEAWEPLVLAKGYRFVYFDGLNRFYVAEEHSDLEGAFSHPPCIFDDFALTGSHGFCQMATNKITELEGRVQSLVEESEHHAAVVVGHQRALMAATNKITEFEGRIRSLAEENEHHTAVVADQQQALMAATEQLAKRADEVECLRDKTSHMRKQITHLQDFVENLRRENERFKKLPAQCEHWRGVAEAHRVQFEKLVQSRSWRLTRPLRGLCRLLRGEYMLTQRAPRSVRHGIKRLLRPVLRPLLLVVMGGVLARPGLRRWWSGKLRCYPTLHRRLLALAWHSGLLEDSSFAAVPPALQSEALSSRAQQIYERLQKVRKFSGRH